MAIQFLKLFQPTQLGTTAALIYTVPTSPSSSLLGNGQVSLINTTASTVAATMYAVPNGSSTSAANEFFPGIGIAPNSSQLVNLPQMAAGDALYGSAGTTSAISIQPMNGVIQSS